MSLKNNKVGVGLRHTHFPEILDRLERGEKFPIGWFEGISENFINSRGRPFEVLMKVREHFDISLHGVSLNLASHEDINWDYLKALRELYHIVRPALVSDHLCWTGVASSNLHNLLPFPYTKENLLLLVDKVCRIQDFLGRPLAFENLSAYFDLKESEMSEAEFLRELSFKTDCKILLDLNNIYVNSKNFDFNPYEYIDQIPMERVSEIHLAGHSDMGKFLFDTHSGPVCENVWQLYEFTISRGNIPTLVEWDEDIPPLSRVFEEALKAKSYWEETDE